MCDIRRHSLSHHIYKQKPNHQETDNRPRREIGSNDHNSDDDTTTTMTTKGQSGQTVMVVVVVVIGEENGWIQL
jgi:hypothetical protein